MALIEVNYQALRSFAREIEDYCELQDQEMARADTGVKNVLGTEWFGTDAAAFGQMWADVDSAESVAVRFRESLKDYAGAVNACANVYQTAQEDIYNLSTLLPRW